MTQFLASVEKHPELSTYKISTRAESIVIEGVSCENELVPLVTADNVLTGMNTILSFHHFFLNNRQSFEFFPEL